MHRLFPKENSESPPALHMGVWRVCECLQAVLAVGWAGGQYRLTPQYAELDLAANRLSVGYSLKGKLKYNTYLVWTEKGRDFILDLVKFRR